MMNGTKTKIGKQVAALELMGCHLAVADTSCGMIHKFTFLVTQRDNHLKAGGSYTT
jgi:hypothetical protein